MKILYLNLDRGIPVLGDKGASVHVRSFITAAQARGHEVALACAALGEGNPPPPALMLPIEPEDSPRALAAARVAAGLPAEALHDTVTRRELGRLAYDKTAAGRIVTALAAKNFVPDVVYERHALFHRAGVDVARYFGVPRLLEVNAPLIEEQRKFRGLRLVGLARQAEFDSYRGADAIIAVSGGVASHVRAVTGGNNIAVIHNGADLQRFAAGVGDDSIRRRLNLGAAPVIGFIGSFKPWHGMAFLLDVFAGLLLHFPELHLLAVGDGPERENIIAKAAALRLGQRVILPGRVPHEEIPAWANAMTLTVAPYLPQPDFYFSPMKIVESLAAGRPVVAPDIGEISGIVRHGENGVLYAPGDSEACGRAIHTLLADTAGCAAMGRQARLDAAGLGWHAVVDRILALVPASALRQPAA
jgi:glycosyltransferase involved in cell wall biosynthesis